MSIAETLPEQKRPLINKRPRVELLEYGKPKSDSDMIFDDGVVPWERIGLGKECTWTSEDRELAVKLKELGTKIEILELKKGLRFQANSWVGHVAFSTFDLVIYPKFDQLESKDKESPLATLLAYAFHLNQLKLIGNQLTPETFFTEILIHFLLAEVQNIQRRGPFQQYHKERRDLSVIRGKIDLKTWLRRGGVPSETMPCVFYRRSLDNIMNRILCAGLRRSVVIAKSPELKSKCRYLADTFAMSVTEKTLDHRMLADAKRGLNRLNAHYEDAIKIIELLFYKGFGGFVHGRRHDDQVRIPGFFFDMNVLFERIFERFFKESLPEYQVRYNKSRRIFSGYESNCFKPIEAGNKWKMRPDFVIKKIGTKKRIVLDTKYYPIAQGKNEPLSQLCLYAMSFSDHPGETPDRRATVLFPHDPDPKRNGTNVEPWHVAFHRHDEKIDSDIYNIINNARCVVTLRPINMIDKLYPLIKNEDVEGKKQYALELIGEK